MKILSLESSCDETAAAVVEDGRKVLSSVVASQVEEHKLYGGVVPEIASRRHTEAICGVTREALEQAILQTAGAESVTFLGGATGLACGYLDFVAWDLMAVLEAAQAFLQKSPLQWASFQTFRQEAQPVTLLDRRQKDTPHTPARRAAFH